MSGSPSIPLVRGAFVVALALVVPACAFETPTSAVPRSYDLGPPPAYARSNAAIPGTVLVASVRAPAWLEDDAIHYRLLYEDPARTQSYATSRWSAEPAALLTDRVRSRIAAVAQGVVSPGYSARSDFTVRIELEDFSQHFSSAGESNVMLRARVTLLASEARTIVAQRGFDMTRRAEPNAAGAVSALAAATETFLEELVTWLAANAKK
jgi:cholesterol transport system auxiliary component